MHKPCPNECIRSETESLIQDLPNSADGYLIGEKEILIMVISNTAAANAPANRLCALWAAVALMVLGGCASELRTQQLYPVTESDGVVVVGSPRCEAITA